MAAPINRAAGNLESEAAGRGGDSRRRGATAFHGREANLLKQSATMAWQSERFNARPRWRRTDEEKKSRVVIGGLARSEAGGGQDG
jgi:hypothetical protein